MENLLVENQNMIAHPITFSIKFNIFCHFLKGAK